MCWFRLLIVILLLQGCFANWSKKDRVKFGGFVALQGIDTWQSTEFIEDKEELNSLYKNKENLVLGKLLVVGLIYGLAEVFPESRGMILNLSCGESGGVVVWNLTQ